MIGSTSILDSLTPAQPTPGMLASSPQAPAQQGGSGSATSILDSLAPSQATPGMVASGAAQAPVAQAPAAPAPKSDKPSLPDWATVHDQAPAKSEQPPAEAPKGGIGNILAGVPAGLYEGVASAVNLPTNVVNAASNLVRDLGGKGWGQIEPLVNPNPMNYQPEGPIATGVHDAASAASNTLALGGAAKAVAPFLAEGGAAKTVADAVGHTPPSVVAASAAGGASEEPIAKNVPEPLQPVARVLGNVATGGLTAGLEGAASNATRSSLTPEAANLANLGKNAYNIPLRAAQLSESPLIKTADSVIQRTVPFSGYSGVREEQQNAFNRAISTEMGQPADKITPEVMSAARNQIGNGLNDIEGRNVAQLTDPFVQRLSDIESNARNSLTDQEYGVVRRQLDNVLSTVQPGDQIAGTTYGNLMHKGSPLDAMTNNTNPNISGYGNQIKDALRQSLQDSLSGDDLNAYRQLRYQWKVMKTIEPLTQRADVVGGPSASTGDINPQALRAAVNKAWPNAAYASQGEIPLNDIADVGQRFLKELNTSQTAERGNMMHMIEKGGALLGGGSVLGEAAGVPVHEHLLGAAAAAIPPWLVARGASAALRSDALANRMIQRGMNPQGPLQGAASSAQGAVVPLVTSAGVRQLEPPQPSVNPTTGLQEFSLDANKQAASNDMGQQVASQILSGDQAHGTLQDFVNQNKRQLRMQYGGQGIQNIMRVGALVRRANVEQTPSTLFGTMVRDGATDIQSLVAKAIANPQITQALAARPNKIGQNRLQVALNGQDGTDTDSSGGLRPASGGGGQVGRASGPPMRPAGLREQQSKAGGGTAASVVQPQDISEQVPPKRVAPQVAA